MTLIIGIDPGSRFTGYGLIRVEGNQSFYVASGCIQLAGAEMAARLQKIYQSLSEIILQYQPQEAAIEQIFMHTNPGSALKLGQARGAAMVALGSTVSEYSARQVKQSVVGYGAASKTQVQHMVNKLLNISETLQADEADALAIALCHAHSRLSQQKMGGAVSKVRRKRTTSWRDYQPDTIQNEKG